MYSKILKILLKSYKSSIYLSFIKPLEHIYLFVKIMNRKISLLPILTVTISAGQCVKSVDKLELTDAAPFREKVIMIGERESVSPEHKSGISASETSSFSSNFASCNIDFDMKSKTSHSDSCLEASSSKDDKNSAMP